MSGGGVDDEEMRGGTKGDAKGRVGLSTTGGRGQCATELSPPLTPPTSSSLVILLATETPLFPSTPSTLPPLHLPPSPPPPSPPSPPPSLFPIPSLSFPAARTSPPTHSSALPSIPPPSSPTSLPPHHHPRHPRPPFQPSPPPLPFLIPSLPSPTTGTPAHPSALTSIPPPSFPSSLPPSPLPPRHWQAPSPLLAPSLSSTVDVRQMQTLVHLYTRGREGGEEELMRLVEVASISHLSMPHQHSVNRVN